MERIKNIIILFVIILGSIFIIFFNFEDKEEIKGKLRIGVSDDTSGFVINYMINKDYFESIKVSDVMETFTINDC
ncbi:hypothetical protein IC214_12030 [Clostridioides sp. ES-S-0190-01]|nr:hypothetical protein [Clostridioides sp. ES-S-0001-02]MCC0639081.1 hypothetical protein [Clostridioides sp. ES-S-0049-03]MCC0652822.1 hypothetical protein [Clostridioides sp. ES-S-0001-03]MCC0657200.1 hypothetical protein [Clostridioides sp. ES-S-0123-01]MCC0672605.1 hypothetical protein [Clostridioides sp. ES-S-0145-01]MCC0675471.1 hypothetical protein [Clostridioides sp. ES-W-0018-02]MCC0680081.1 hypothetical protein [Clostridioides sp. ES-S-0005-03]MCC0696145.1 hypothetical protein [Cl